MNMIEKRNLSGESVEEYALWLKPDNEVYDVLKRIIDSLSEEYSTYRFEPHITVAGRITNPVDDIIKTMEKVASESKPMTLYLTETAYSDSFYRSLFINVAPNDVLLDLREQCITELKREHEPYMPHLSLMYKTMDAGVKKKIIERVGKRFDLVFIPVKLYLMRTTGRPDTWKEISQAPLIT